MQASSPRPLPLLITRGARLGRKEGSCTCIYTCKRQIIHIGYMHRKLSFLLCTPGFLHHHYNNYSFICFEITTGVTYNTSPN